MIKKLIESSIIIESLSATTKKEAFEEMLQHAIDADRLEATARASVRKALLDRESNGSTGIGNGIAVPHVKSKKIPALALVIACSPDGIPFQAVDGRDVQTVFLVLGPDDAPQEHLQVLRWVSMLARNADFRRFITGAGSAAAIRELLYEMGTT